MGQNGHLIASLFCGWGLFIHPRVYCRKEAHYRYRQDYCYPRFHTSPFIPCSFFSLKKIGNNRLFDKSGRGGKAGGYPTID